MEIKSEPIYEKSQVKQQVYDYYSNSFLKDRQPRTCHTLLVPEDLPYMPVFLPSISEKRRSTWQCKRAVLPRKEVCHSYFYRIVNDAHPRRYKPDSIRFVMRDGNSTKLVLYLADFYHFDTPSFYCVQDRIPVALARHTSIFINYLDIFQMHMSADDVCEEIEHILNFYQRPTCVVGQGVGAALGMHLASRANLRFIALNMYDLKALPRVYRRYELEISASTSDSITNMVLAANYQLKRYWALGDQQSEFADAFAGKNQFKKTLIKAFTTELTCFNDGKAYDRVLSAATVESMARALLCSYSSSQVGQGSGIYVYSFHSPFLDSKSIKGRDDVCFVPFCGHDLMVEGFDVISSIIAGK